MTPIQREAEEIAAAAWKRHQQLSCPVCISRRHLPPVMRHEHVFGWLFWHAWLLPQWRLTCWIFRRATGHELFEVQ